MIRRAIKLTLAHDEYDTDIADIKDLDGMFADLLYFSYQRQMLYKYNSQVNDYSYK